MTHARNQRASIHLYDKCTSFSTRARFGSLHFGFYPKNSSAIFLHICWTCLLHFKPPYQITLKGKIERTERRSPPKSNRERRFKGKLQHSLEMAGVSGLSSRSVYLTDVGARWSGIIFRLFSFRLKRHLQKMLCIFPLTYRGDRSIQNRVNNGFARACVVASQPDTISISAAQLDRSLPFTGWPAAW